MIRLFCVVTLLSVVLPLAAAERGFVPIRRAEGAYVALVIGNGGYPDAPLANPVNDATDVAAALRGFGFVVDLLPDADRIQMADGIARFRSQLPKAKAAVFYYAGHGVQVQGENWLLPIGRDSATQITDETQVSSRALNAEEVIQAMELAKVPMNLVVLDACRNNPYRGSGRGRATGLAELRAPVGSLILYATAAGKTAADGAGRNSPFTAAFLKHVSTPGLDVRLLPSEITNTVGELTGGVQVPWQSASLKAGFFFVPPMSDEEKFTAEKARKTEELQQAEMQAKLRDLVAQSRVADAAHQQQLAAETKRVEDALAASKQASADLTKQLDLDLAASRERERTEVDAAKVREDKILSAKQQEIAALDAQIAAMKAGKTNGPTDEGADLDAMVAVMEQRTARKAELKRLEQEAESKRAKAAAEAVDRRRQEEIAAAARRQAAETEATAKRQAAIQAEQAKAAELARMQAAERSALAARLEKDVAKYQRLAASEDGADMAQAAWVKICTLYKAGDVKSGDVEELTERVLPGTRAAAAATAAATKMAPWATRVGRDTSGAWAILVVGGQTQVLRLIPAGTFTMGSDANSDEKPAHQVALSAFWVGDSEVTQGLWQAVMGSNPSKFTGAANPVEQVSWDDCQGFFQKLNGQVTGLRAGFPTEAQWEYACRAGTTGDYAGDLDAMAWYDTNAGETTHPVKTKQANAFGLYDMHGNVWEWCADWYADAYPAGSQRDPPGPVTRDTVRPPWAYPAGSQRDPPGPSSGSDRVDRGGSWDNGRARYCRSASRSRRSPDNRDSDLGFRLAAQATP